MVENKILDVQKIQSHLNAIKAMAQAMLVEAEKVEQMLQVKEKKKFSKVDADFERFRLKRMARRLKGK